MSGKKTETASRKAKRLTQREIMTNIEQLAQGDSISYRLPEAYGAQLAVVEFNTTYPWRGGKYILSTQKLVEDNPNRERALVLESNEAKDIAAWVSRHRGVPHSNELPESDEIESALGKRE
jgi:hypothetical protein